MKNKNNLDIKAIKDKATKFVRAESKHAVFLAIMIVLVVYMLFVWKIGRLSAAEPSDSENATVQTQIASLEHDLLTSLLINQSASVGT